MIILKVSKKQGFTVSKKNNFGKTSGEGGWGGGGVKLNPPGPSGFIHEKGGRRIYDL